MKLLAFLLALAVAPVGAQAATLTVVPATATSAAVPVYVARPRGTGAVPAVLVLHGCDGFSAFEAFVADRLAAHGFVAAALDSIPAADPHGVCERGASGSKTEAADALATLAWLRTQPYVAPDQLGLIGFSMGGIAILDLIDPRSGPAPAIPGLRAAVANYPACEGRNGSVSVPLAIFDGDADQITPVAPCAAMVRAGTAAGKTLQITTYPGATHGFLVPGVSGTFMGQPIRFDPQAAADAAMRTLQFLQQYLAL